MKNLLRATALLLSLIALVACVAPALADFGDFDTGGDYSGSDYDSDGGGGGIMGLLMLPIFLVMMIYALFKQLVEKIRYRLTMRGLSALKEEDPAFSEADLQAWIRDLYTHMQADWENGDISDLQGEFTTTCWDVYDTQLRRKVLDGYTGHVRDIQFTEIKPLGWCRKEDLTYMDVRLMTRIISWNTNRDGAISTGSTTEPKNMEYLWRLQRPADALTSAEARACPNCGTMQPRLMARCANCGAALERDDRQWKLYDITGGPRKKQ